MAEETSDEDKERYFEREREKKFAYMGRKFCRRLKGMDNFKKDRRDLKISIAKDYVNQWKKTHPCIVCGEVDIVCLDYHHINGKKTKKANVSQLVGSGLSIELIKKEMDKCIVICANCHRKLHAKRFRLEKYLKK